jgi:hypothetical protein
MDGVGVANNVWDVVDPSAPPKFYLRIQGSYAFCMADRKFVRWLCHSFAVLTAIVGIVENHELRFRDKEIGAIAKLKLEG